MAAGLLLVVLALLGLLCIAGLVALVIWLARRTQPPTTPGDASKRAAAPR